MCYWIIEKGTIRVSSMVLKGGRIDERGYKRLFAASVLEERKGNSAFSLDEPGLYSLIGFSLMIHIISIFCLEVMVVVVV